MKTVNEKKTWIESGQIGTPQQWKAHSLLIIRALRHGNAIACVINFNFGTYLPTNYKLGRSFSVLILV